MLLPIEESQIKSKTVMSWSSFFVPFILSEGNFFKICVLSQCIVYWRHFQKIHTFTYQKILLHTLLLLWFLKLEKAFSVSWSHFNLSWSFSANQWTSFYHFSLRFEVFLTFFFYCFILIFLSLWSWFSTVILQSRFVVQSRFGSFLAC